MENAKPDVPVCTGTKSHLQKCIENTIIQRKLMDMYSKSRKTTKMTSSSKLCAHYKGWLLASSLAKKHCKLEGKDSVINKIPKNLPDNSATFKPNEIYQVKTNDGSLLYRSAKQVQALNENLDEKCKLTRACVISSFKSCQLTHYNLEKDYT